MKAIQVSDDGRRALTGSFDYSAILWDITVEPPKQLLRLADHNAAVNAVAFVNGTARALTAGDDSLVRLWDLATGKLIHTFEGHDAGSKIVGLSVSDEWAVSAGWDRTARLWNLEARQAGPVLREHRGPVNAVAFSGVGLNVTGAGAIGENLMAEWLVFTASADGDIRVFAASDGTVKRRLHGAGQGVNVLRRLSSGDTSVRSTEGNLRGVLGDPLLFGTVSGQSGILDGRTGEAVRLFPEVQRPILAVADGTNSTDHTRSTRPGTVAVGSGDGLVRVFRDSDGVLLHEYKSAFGPVWALAMRRRGPTNEANALYYAGLDDFATYWPFAPRAPFEPVDASQYPRRFQMTGKSGDDMIAKGELQFARKCSICHTLTPDGANRAGPTLHGVFGRRIATLSGYNFSPELKTLDITWNAETIAKLFELGPDKFTPGSKMPLQVMSDKAEREALVAFLAQATK